MLVVSVPEVSGANSPAVRNQAQKSGKNLPHPRRTMYRSHLCFRFPSPLSVSSMETDSISPCSRHLRIPETHLTHLSHHPPLFRIVPRFPRVHPSGAGTSEKWVATRVSGLWEVLDGRPGLGAVRAGLLRGEHDFLEMRFWSERVGKLDQGCVSWRSPSQRCDAKPQARPSKHLKHPISRNGVKRTLPHDDIVWKARASKESPQ